MSIARVIPKDEQRLAAYTRKAQRASKLKKFNEAETYFLKALKINPHDFYCLLGLGYVLNAKDQFIRALDSFKKVLEVNPYSTEVLSPIADCYFELGLFSRAIEYYNLSLRTDSEDVASHFKKGLAHLNLGNYSEMNKNFGEILNIEGNEETSRCYYGLSLLFIDKNKDAYHELAGVLQSRCLTKYNVIAKMGMQVIFYPFIKRKKQLHLHLASKLPTTTIDIISQYDNVPLLIENEFRAAPNFLCRENPFGRVSWLQSSDRVDVHYLSGIAYRAIGEYSLAHESFLQALSELKETQSPFTETSLSVYLHIAFTYQKQHKIELAIKILKKVEPFCPIENEDLLNLIKNLESKRMLGAPPVPHSPLEMRNQSRKNLFIPKEKKSDDIVYAITPHEARTFIESHTRTLTDLAKSPESYRSTASTERTILNIDSSASPSMLSPVSSSPSSENKEANKKTLFANHSAPLPTNQEALNEIDLPRTLAGAQKKSLFKPTPFTIHLNATEMKAAPTPAKKRCVIL